MTTVKAIDLSGNEVEFTNVQDVYQYFGDKQALKERCGPHPFFGLIQCPDCKKVSPKQFCGKLFVYATVIRSEPIIMVDGEPVKEIVEVIKGS